VRTRKNTATKETQKTAANKPNRRWIFSHKQWCLTKKAGSVTTLGPTRIWLVSINVQASCWRIVQKTDSNTGHVQLLGSLKVQKKTLTLPRIERDIYFLQRILPWDFLPFSLLQGPPAISSGTVLTPKVAQLSKETFRSQLAPPCTASAKAVSQLCLKVNDALLIKIAPLEYSQPAL